MTTVKLECLGCGEDIHLPPADLGVTVDGYLYDHCGHTWRNTAPPRLRQILLISGARDMLQADIEAAAQVFAADLELMSWEDFV